MKMGSEETRIFEGGVNGVQCGSRDGDVGVKTLQGENNEYGETRLCCEIDDSEESESVFEAASMVFSMRNSKFGYRNARTASSPMKRVSRETKMDDIMTYDFKETANSIKMVSRETKIEKTITDDFEETAKKPLGCGYEVGDMVWGKVKPYPWWPGQIFDEAFAVPSVGKTKKEGHVLVAFFGDSSYAWLNPKNIIPFDPHYAEKSTKTNDQAFFSAVEDAENEACKRAALGLACRCRNPSNFQPMDVPGSYVVDVGGYEPCGVYSAKQIRRARDGFRPLEMLSFVQQLALMPYRRLQGNVNWIKSAAKVLAYRMSVFKEFDETFSQASGIELVCPASSKKVANQPEKELSQETLSSSLQIPEARCKKSATPTKNQHMREDKRIDHPNILKADPFGQEQQSVLSPSMYEEGATFSDREYALERKDLLFSINTKFTGQESEIYTHRLSSGKKIVAMDKQAVCEQVSSINAMVYREQNRTELINRSQGFQQPLSSLLKTVGNHNKPENTYMAGRITSLLTTPHPGKAFPFTSSRNMNENPKALKRSEEDLSSEKAVMEDVRKKKETESSLDVGREYPYKHLKPANIQALARQSAGKSSQTILVHRESSLMEQQRKEDTAYPSISSGSAARQQINTRNVENGLPQLISELLALALDPFHGTEQNIPEIVFQFFMKFRSIVYQKNLVVSPSESIENQRTKPFAFTVAAESRPVGIVCDLPFSSKPPKKRLKFDHNEKAGHDDHILDCEEEMSTKSLKHLNDLKSLTAKKKASNLKPLKSQERDCQEMGEIVPKKHVENLLKKAVIAESVSEPTMLVMNFPRQSALPSVSELKAKFARFGPLHQSATLVSWESSQCQIVFKCKSDAEAAYVYAAQSSYLFGNVKVYYQLQTLRTPAPELGKQLVEEAQDKLPQSTSLSSSNSAETELQPKSCLKKPPGDEVRSTTAIPSKTPHVKFMLVGDESSIGEQLVIGSNIKNLNDNHPGGGSSSSFATVNVNVRNFQRTRNFQRVRNFQKVAPSSPPLIRLPNQLPDALDGYEVDRFVEACNLRYCQAGVRNNCIYTSTPSHNVDISNQMLSLLSRCSEIVDELKYSFGYMPFCL